MKTYTKHNYSESDIKRFVADYKRGIKKANNELKRTNISQIEIDYYSESIHHCYEMMGKYNSILKGEIGL